MATRTTATRTLPGQRRANVAESRASSVRSERRRTRLWNTATIEHPGQQVTHEPQPQQGAEGQPDDDKSDTGAHGDEASTPLLGQWQLVGFCGAGRLGVVLGDEVLGGGHQLHLCA